VAIRRLGAKLLLSVGWRIPAAMEVPNVPVSQMSDNQRDSKHSRQVEKRKYLTATNDRYCCEFGHSGGSSEGCCSSAPDVLDFTSTFKMVCSFLK
jgi:hypothetical protein